VFRHIPSSYNYIPFSRLLSLLSLLPLFSPPAILSPHRWPASLPMPTGAAVEPEVGVKHLMALAEFEHELEHRRWTSRTSHLFPIRLAKRNHGEPCCYNPISPSPLCNVVVGIAHWNLSRVVCTASARRWRSPASVRPHRVWVHVRKFMRVVVVMAPRRKPHRRWGIAGQRRKHWPPNVFARPVHRSSRQNWRQSWKMLYRCNFGSLYAKYLNLNLLMVYMSKHRVFLW
jgi:hypothetical protein